MLQPRRLEVLMEQVFEHQSANCAYHNQFTSNYSLLNDHKCQKLKIPSQQIASLKKHKDEVWLVKFSRCGQYFASTGNDKQIIIWQVSKEPTPNVGAGYRYIIKCFNLFKGHKQEINCTNWTNQSPKWIVSGGKEKSCLVWDAFSGQ
jgi:WD40 repeat protein